MNSEKLKPCPFCGGEAEIVEDRLYGEDYYAGRCRSCAATSIFEFTKEEAVNKWNRRNYSVFPNSSKELMDFVKFCRNASANDIMQIHDRARDLIAKHKECCKYAECKDGREINFPTIPKLSYADELGVERSK